MKTKSKFPFEHIVNYSAHEVWVKCSSSITALGLPTLVNHYYPGFNAKIATEEYFETLKSKMIF